MQSGQAKTGAEILQRVYYEYATSFLADQAYADLRKIPAETALPPVTYAQHLKRADALYKARRWGAAATSINTWSIFRHRASSRPDLSTWRTLT